MPLLYFSDTGESKANEVGYNHEPFFVYDNTIRDDAHIITRSLP